MCMYVCTFSDIWDTQGFDLDLYSDFWDNLDCDLDYTRQNYLCVFVNFISDFIFHNFQNCDFMHS